jgi:NAD(P)-dependent dehydrogenase (short-subunit alcohol dehydrogenase family)
MEWFGENPPTAVVTGGASGIGRALCELLSKEGYRVAVADRDKRGADEVAHHIDGYAFEVDVADEASVVAMFDGALAAFGGTLDALATPAGIAETTPFMDITVDAFRRVHEINVIGTFLCVREAAKRMRAGGRICTVASVAGKRGGGLSGTAAYAASKGGVLALSRSAARSLAPLGIAVNCVAPGPTLTPMLDEPFKNAEQRQRVESMTLLGRAGEPREIAEAIAWLLSPRSSYVAGETLTIDGGLMLD